LFSSTDMGKGKRGAEGGGKKTLGGYSYAGLGGEVEIHWPGSLGGGGILKWPELLAKNKKNTQYVTREYRHSWRTDNNDQMRDLAPKSIHETSWG